VILIPRSTPSVLSIPVIKIEIGMVIVVVRPLTVTLPVCVDPFIEFAPAIEMLSLNEVLIREEWALRLKSTVPALSPNELALAAKVPLVPPDNDVGPPVMAVTTLRKAAGPVAVNVTVSVR